VSPSLIKENPLRHRKILAGISAGFVAALAIAVGLTMASADSSTSPPSTTPIKHIVVIFDENVSFDHYFATYPNATNPAGEPGFIPAPGTPSVNGLSGPLLTNNPNSDNPARLDRSQAVTCDQDHAYGAEQQAADAGLMDQFVQFTAGGGCADKSIVMDYYDGNTVTGLWNYAQHYSLNDDSFGTVFGPSTPGALNLISGDNGGATSTAPLPGTLENGTLINDADPTYDDCSSGTTASLSGKNVGDLLNAHNVTWGWFEGGFTPTASNGGKAVCGASHVNIAGAKVNDYVQHHEPFQYYASTANPHHLPPSSVGTIGQTDAANHQYDISYFNQALKHGDLPAVSFLKAAAYEDGHAGYSDPLDEQRFLVNTINALESSPDWSSTAIVIAYDDSDGWYDHVMGPIVRASSGPSDALNGVGKCGNVPANPPASFENDRCGFGPRLPLLVISPWAKQNFVDNTLTDQSSILKFIEDNWELGRIGGGSTDAAAGSLGNMFDFNPNDQRSPKVILDETTGLVVSSSPSGGQGSSSGGGSSGSGGGSGSSGNSDSSGDQGLSDSGGSSGSGAGSGASGNQGSSNQGSAGGQGGSGGQGSSGQGSSGQGSSAHGGTPWSITCSAKSKAAAVTVTCTVGGASSRGASALRFRVVKGAHVLATARTAVHGSSARAVLRTAKPLSRGSYTLRVALTSRAGVIGSQQTVKLG
jgi:phospholipase C